MKKTYLKVSIIVVNWNGKKHLQYCLPSLKKLNYPNYEVLLVDNASTDGSIEFVKKYHPWVKLIANKENLGYVGGNNLGMDKSDGNYVLVLNNDTEVTPDFLKFLVEDMEKDPQVACVQPKMLCRKDKKLLDVMGSFMTDTGFLYHYGFLQDASLPRFNRQREIFSAKGSCILLRNDLLEKMGKFDDDYFIFFEETDLCYRYWLAGFKVIYEPRAVIYHEGAGDTAGRFADERRIYLALKNRIDSYIKNMEPLNLFRYLVTLALFYLIILIVYLATGEWSQARGVIRAVLWNIIHLPNNLKKRIEVQKFRRISDGEIFRRVKRNPPLKFLYYNLGGFKNFESFKDTLKTYDYPEIS